MRGEFVLRKGQPIKNEDVAIEVVDIHSPDECADEGSFRSGARARVQFRRVRDRYMICEQVVRERQSGNLPLSGRDELAGLGIAGFETSAINVRDQWIVLRLFT